MKKILKSHLVLIILLAFAGAGGILYFIPGLFTFGSVQYDSDDPGYNKQYWRQEIVRNGAEPAYREFVERNTLVAPPRRHFRAHAMGEALFEEFGIAGIRVCDDLFGFGCYHGVSSRAIAEGGQGALIKLDAACTETFGILSGCKHGLGHGILDYVGHENLTLALDMCTTLVDQPVPLLGCVSGVLMEYLAPLVRTDGNLVPTSRELDPEHPYAPCYDIAKEFRASCFFELGQWFRQTRNIDYGALCGALEGDQKMHCFLGIGIDLTRGWKDPDTLIAKCARYAPENELACRAGAAWSLTDSNTAFAMCAYADVDLKRKCVDTADFTEGIDESIRKSLE